MTKDDVIDELMDCDKFHKERIEELQVGIRKALKVIEDHSEDRTLRLAKAQLLLTEALDE